MTKPIPGSSIVEKAILTAIRAHRGQRDKAGVPYILHPLRVMMKMDSDEEMVVAVLHDVIEDGKESRETLKKAGFPRPVLDALVSITRQIGQGESYDDYIQRVSRNEIARKVKIADLEDNMDIRRIPKPSARDLERVLKYRRAWQTLTKGGP